MTPKFFFFIQKKIKYGQSRIKIYDYYDPNKFSIKYFVSRHLADDINWPYLIVLYKELSASRTKLSKSSEPPIIYCLLHKKANKSIVNDLRRHIINDSITP